MALFRKTEGKTFLVLDIENGSIGAALAQLGTNERPRLLSQTRVELPLTSSLKSAELAGHIERAVREALAHTSLVASRLRNAQQMQVVEEPARAAVFLGAPWGSPNLAEGRPDFVPGMQEFLRQELASFVDAPTSFYTAAAPAGHGAARLYPTTPTLVIVMQGELLELILMNEGRVESYATVPAGYRSLLRTLQTHGGLSAAEAHSTLNLAAHWDTEPVHAAAQHLSSSMQGILEPLLASTTPAQVVIISHGLHGEWLARALGDDDTLGDYFPSGAEVRALGSHALSSHVLASAPKPDVPLMLDALYLNRLFI